MGGLTAYNLYRQELNPTAPPFIDIFADVPWWIWLGLLILILFLPKITDWLRSEPTANEISVDNSTEIKTKDQTGGTNIGSARDVHIHSQPPPTYPIEARLGTYFLINDELDSSKIKIFPWNPTFVDDVVSGIKIENNTGHDLTDCDVELMSYKAYYDNPYIQELQDDNQETTPMDDILPASLFWVLNRHPISRKISIDRGKEGYVGLVFKQIQKGSIKTVQNDCYVQTWTDTRTIIITPRWGNRGTNKIRISAEIDGKNIEPIIRFASVIWDKQKNSYVVKKIAENEDLIDRENHMVAVGQFRGIGAQLRIRLDQLLTVDQLDQWIAEYNNWEEDMLAAVAQISEAKAEELRILGDVPNRVLPNALNSNHSRYYRVITEKLMRLRAFQEEYNQRHME